MKKVLTVRNILIAIPALLLLVALHYALPQVDVVRAVGVEIKRMDATEANSGQTRTRDVYFIQMETPDGDPRVYRNEDNLIYGKFDSADVQAQVQSFAAEKQLVAVRHYGWRIALFSMFPNAIKVWPVEEGYRHIPVFNIVFLSALALLIVFVVRRVRQTMARTRQALESKREAREAREAAASRKAQGEANRSRQASQKKDDELNAFLNTDTSKQD